METPQSVEILRQESQSISVLLETKIENDEQMAAVSDRIKEVKDFGTRAKAEQDKLVDPANEIIAHAKATYGPFITQAKNVEAALKEKGVAYVVAKNAKVEHKKEVIATQVERGGRGGLSMDTGMRKLDELGDTQKTVKTGFSGFQLKTIQDFEVTDEAAIPEEFFDRTLNRKRVYAAVITAKLVVPGVKVITKHSGASV